MVNGSIVQFVMNKTKDAITNTLIDLTFEEHLGVLGIWASIY
jgi:hypothetical protein